MTNPGLSGVGHLSYTRVAIVLHWIIAFAILLQLGLGWGLHHIPPGPQRFGAFQLHKSIGLTILLMSIVRLAWRFGHPAPPEEHMPRWQRLAAGLVHTGLYVIMIGLPFTGWIMVSTSKLPIPTRLFGLVLWPALPILPALPPMAKAEWNTIGSGSHTLLVYVTVAMLALHVGAVLQHQLIDPDGVFARMAPGARSGWKEARFWGVLVVALSSLAFGYGVLGRAGGLHVPDATPSGAATGSDLASMPTVDGTIPDRDHGAVSTSVPDQAADKPEKTAALQVPAWQMQEGSLAFATSWGGSPIKGRFASWTPTIVFSPDALAQSSLTVRVDLASATTGDAQRDAALPTADWFDTANHPSATFRSTRIKATGGMNYVASGSLELRGVRRAIELPFSVKIEKDHATARGVLTIDRTNFGVGQGDWAATDQIPAAVAVTFSLRAKKSGE